MYSSRGFNDPVWMAQVIMLRADPYLVKKSVIDLMQYLDGFAAGEEEEEFAMDELFDRLVQVAVRGEYTRPDGGYYETSEEVATGDADGTIQFTEQLTEEQEKMISDFAEIMKEGLSDDTEDGEGAPSGA